jgi:hypothetical protein
LLTEPDHLQERHLTPFETTLGLNIYAGETLILILILILTVLLAAFSFTRAAILKGFQSFSPALRGTAPELRRVDVQNKPSTLKALNHALVFRPIWLILFASNVAPVAKYFRPCKRNLQNGRIMKRRIDFLFKRKEK